MSIVIEDLSPASAAQYDELLERSPVAMFNHTLRYRKFLEVTLREAEAHYLCAFFRDEMIAALPLFLKRGVYGTVINSLPFYGSHGGFICRQGASLEAHSALTEVLNALCNKVGAFSCTIIESPWETDRRKYERFSANMFDERIGQITPLPSGASSEEVGNALFSIYHQKTRNMVRKGLKSGFEVSHDGSAATTSALHAIHEQNILAIGGLAKPAGVFQNISKVFEYDRDYRIYLARKDGQIVSGLLLFYFKDTVEYFCPATVEAHRSDQPLSLLIFVAMRDAIIQRRARHWNWGGTWLSQSGVYQFKARWGTTDFRYRYHTRLKPEIDPVDLRKDILMSEYPNFFTLPFSALGVA